MRLLLILFALPLIANSQRTPSLAPSYANATVLWGAARFTVLTPSLLRLELAGSGGFDDRATLAVVNRALLPPAFTIGTSNKTVTITTSELVLTYTSVSGNVTPSGSTCALAQPADAVDGRRVAAFPFGANASGQTVCCHLCDSDSNCSAWIFNPTTGAAPNCWLMEGVTRVEPASGRVTGARLPFTADALHVDFNLDGSGARAIWNASMRSEDDAGNLRGAFHALDCYDAPSECIPSYEKDQAPALLSTSGWFLLDDTLAARIVPPAPQTDSPVPFWYANYSSSDGPLADWYLFAGGKNYTRTLTDAIKIMGAPALPPVHIFGVWWSHWQSFSETEFNDEILSGYRNNSLPLHSVSLDVDWHTENPGNATVPCYSYGGYTVNSTLFPLWTDFVNALHSGENSFGSPLHLFLNLHPQGGTDACQKNWPAFAAAIGTTSNAIVPCTFGNQRIAAASFSAFMDADDLTNVDGWWTDFDYTSDCFDAPTASTPSSFAGIAWSNEVFAEHQRARLRRPLLLSRSGGLGAHRAAVSFSGDANQHQEVLRWQLSATPRAANALHNTWSHDIGGFMCYHINQTECSGDPSLPSNGLLYLRWIQAGAVFPILRTHASEWNLAVMERRVWKYPAYFPFMADAMRLRAALLPYVYTEARRAFDTGVAMVHSMYIDFPLELAAYSAPEQFFFGTVLIAAPIWAANETIEYHNMLGSFRSAWLPPGTWISFNGTMSFVGNQTTSSIFYSLGDIPLFARAGSVMPLSLNNVRGITNDPLIVAVWPGGLGDGSNTTYELYEDDDTSSAFETGASARTLLTTSTSDMEHALTTVIVDAMQGSYAGALNERNVTAQLRGFISVQPFSVTSNGIPISEGLPPCASPCWWVVTEELHTLATPSGSLIIEAGRYSTHSATIILVEH
jgi:alpha-glucosidase (family GH31 glycosyl hydrolase)